MAIIALELSDPPALSMEVAPERVATHANGDPLKSTVVTISCHAYTHVDAPLHFLPDGPDIATMPIDQWIGEAADRRSGVTRGERRVTGGGAVERHGTHVSTGRHRAAPGRIGHAGRAWQTARFWQEGPSPARPAAGGSSTAARRPWARLTA
jgi:hypothetical protein